MMGGICIISILRYIFSRSTLNEASAVSKALILPPSPTVIGNDPVFYCQVDNFLPDADYRQLRDSFPDDSWFDDLIEGNKKRINSRRSSEIFDRFCATHPQWQQLFEQMRARPFVDSVYALLKQPLREIRGRVGGRRWNVDGSASGPLDWLRRNAVLNFEFSRLENGSNVPPHTDAPEKLATLILYFADPAWQPEWGGGTFLYRPKHPALLKNWHNRRIPFEEVEEVVDNQFVGNRLFVFTKSADSWHGLPEIHCPPDIVRNSVNINILLKPGNRFKRFGKMRGRVGRSLEQRRHPY